MHIASQHHGSSPDSELLELVWFTASSVFRGGRAHRGPWVEWTSCCSAEYILCPLTTFPWGLGEMGLPTFSSSCLQSRATELFSKGSENLLSLSVHLLVPLLCDSCQGWAGDLPVGTSSLGMGVWDCLPCPLCLAMSPSSWEAP